MTTPDPARIFGNYEILARLGRGGMAEVFRARVIKGPRAGWMVALKRLLPELADDPGYVDLFASEADLLRFLTHPNIVQVYEAGLLDDVYFMVMEWVDGRDLGQILRRCKQRTIPLPVDFALYITRVLVDALGYAHEAKSPSGRPLGLVHCDVSPSNLFISRGGEVKLGDFGVARGPLLTRAEGLEGRVEGKPFYFSPEVLAGEVSPQADLWAAAVLLSECLTLERPFRGQTPEEVFASIRSGGRLRPSAMRPDMPPGVDAVLERALAKRPQDRFASAAAFADALTPLYDERVGTPLGIAGLVRGLFGVGDGPG